MARPGITYEQVQSAADILWKQGVTPSIQRVREALRTGSNSTIATHLKRWQQERADQTSTTLPPSIPDRVINAVEAFWAIAFEQAETNFDDYREQVAQAVAQAEQQRNNAISELTLYRDEARAVNQRLIRERSKTRELEKHLLIEQERVKAIESKHRDTEDRLVKVNQRVDQLCEEAKVQTSRHNASIQQLSVEFERRLAEADQRLAFERERSEASEARLSGLLDKTNFDYKQDKTRFTQERRAWQEEKATLENRIAAGQFSMAVVEQTNQRLSAQLQQIEFSYKTEHDRYLKTARLVDELRTRLKAANADRRRLDRLVTAQTKA